MAKRNPLLDNLGKIRDIDWSAIRDQINRGISDQRLRDTFIPGQSVNPGSISDIPLFDRTYSTPTTPEHVWFSQYEGRNMIDYILALLKNSNNGGSLSQGYADVLQQVIRDLQTNSNAAINPDWLISLFQNLLSYQTTQEQRSYDYGMLQESRVYNDPLNELSRLMGAGISRDAAIQLLSGSSGSAGGFSSAAAPIQGVAAGAGAAALNSSNAHSNLVANVLNGLNFGLQALSTLNDMGVSMSQAIPTVQMMQSQAYLSNESTATYDAVNQVSKALQSMQLNGVIEPSDVDSWSNADDVYKWLLDHVDTEAVSPLVKSGAFQRSFGTTMGREMFNKHWKEQRDSRDAGTLLDEYITQQKLHSSLMQIDENQGFIDINKSLNDLVLQDHEIQLTYQAILSGELELQIKGHAVRGAKAQADMLEDQAYKSSIDRQVTELVMEGDPTGEGGMSGLAMLSQSQWRQLYQHLRYLAVNNSPENNAKFEEFLQNNFEAACAVALINQASQSHLSSIWQSDGNGVPSLLRFMNLFNATGADKLVDLVATGAEIGTGIYGVTHKPPVTNLIIK